MRGKYLLVATVLAAATMIHADENLGTIQIESTTIDDKYDANKKEVSNTVVIKGEKIEAVLDRHTVRPFADEINMLDEVGAPAVTPYLALIHKFFEKGNRFFRQCFRHGPPVYLVKVDIIGIQPFQ